MAGQFPRPPSSLGNFQCKITMPPKSVSTLCHLTPPPFATILAFIQLNVSHVAKKIVQKQKNCQSEEIHEGKKYPAVDEVYLQIIRKFVSGRRQRE